MKFINVEVYECPYCSKLLKSESDMERHVEKCLRNPNVVQKYSECKSLYSDYKYQSILGYGHCIYTGKFSSGCCPYAKHKVDI